MAYSDGIITEPVSIYDVQRALGVSVTDLGTLCKHPNLRLMSRYKPTDYQTLCFNPMTETALADSQWKGKMVTDTSGVNIRASVGLDIPFFRLPDSLFTSGTDYAFFNVGTYGVPSTLIESVWGQATVDKYRLADFWKYCHTIPTYPISNKKYPVSFSNLTIQTLSYNSLQQSGTMLAVAEIHFDYNDISIQNLAYALGVKNLFDAQNGVPTIYNLYFGFMLIKYPSDSPRFAITNAVEVQLDANYDQTTGLTGVRNIALDGAALIKPGDQGFHVGDSVYLVPYIRRTISIAGVAYRYYFCLNCENTTEYHAFQQFTISNNPLTIYTVKLTSASITITYQKVRTTTGGVVIRFWISNVNHITFNFTGQGIGPNDNANRFYFLTTDFGVMRNDGNGYMVDQNFATLGLREDDNINARFSNITTANMNATGILYGISDAQSLSVFYTEYEYPSTLTSAKIGIHMIIMDNPTGTEMTQRSVTFQTTINPSATGDQAQTTTVSGVISQ